MVVLATALAMILQGGVVSELRGFALPLVEISYFLFELHWW